MADITIEDKYTYLTQNTITFLCENCNQYKTQLDEGVFQDIYAKYDRRTHSLEQEIEVYCHNASDILPGFFSYTDEASLLNQINDWAKAQGCDDIEDYIEKYGEDDDDDEYEE